MQGSCEEGSCKVTRGRGVQCGWRGGACKAARLVPAVEELGELALEALAVDLELRLHHLRTRGRVGTPPPPSPRYKPDAEPPPSVQTGRRPLPHHVRPGRTSLRVGQGGGTGGDLEDFALVERLLAREVHLRPTRALYAMIFEHKQERSSSHGASVIYIYIYIYKINNL